MNLLIEQGQTIRLPADFYSGDDLCDPTDPLLHIFNPSDVKVAAGLIPKRRAVGVYYCDFAVGHDAPVGSWVARWTGTINGRLVGGDDVFQVLQRPPVEIVVTQDKTSQPAKGTRPMSDEDLIGERLASVLSGRARTISAPPPSKAKGRRGRVRPSSSGPAQNAPARRGVPAKPVPRIRPKVLVPLLIALLVLGAVYSQRTRASQVQKIFDDADVAFKKGQFAQAETLYFRALDKDPRNKFAHFNLGILAQQKNRTEEAMYYYNRSLAADPDFLPALYNKASLQEAWGRTDDAVATYRYLLKSSPSHAPSHFNLGILLYSKLGDQQQGRREIGEALKLNPALTSQLDPKLAEEITPPNKPAP